MKKINELKKLIETGKISMEDALKLRDWINEQEGKKGPSTQSDPADNPPHKPPNP